MPPWGAAAPAPNGPLNVDLEAEVDFGGRHSAAQAPIVRRGFDKRDFDIEGGHSERLEIADDGLVERSFGSHRSPGKHRDFDQRKSLTAAGRDGKVRDRVFDQAQRSIRFGNFQCVAKRRLNGIDHRRGVSDPAGARRNQGVWRSPYAALAGGRASTE
jgi:hypothetical protein